MKIYTDQTKIKYSSEQIILYGLLKGLSGAPVTLGHAPSIRI